MPHAEPRSLQQIERETEQTRAGLTDTVEEASYQRDEDRQRHT